MMSESCFIPRKHKRPVALMDPNRSFIGTILLSVLYATMATFLLSYEIYQTSVLWGLTASIIYFVIGLVVHFMIFSMLCKGYHGRWVTLHLIRRGLKRKKKWAKFIAENMHYIVKVFPATRVTDIDIAYLVNMLDVYWDNYQVNKVRGRLAMQIFVINKYFEENTSRSTLYNTAKYLAKLGKNLYKK